jgi:hypothetical protein
LGKEKSEKEVTAMFNKGSKLEKKHEIKGKYRRLCDQNGLQKRVRSADDSDNHSVDQHDDVGSLIIARPVTTCYSLRVFQLFTIYFSYFNGLL